MSFIYTAEQQAIIHYKGPLLVVRAGAGCTKTSTLEAFARHSPEERMFYLVFGKTNQTEAQERFRGTRVVSRTQHAIALARCGLNIKHKITDNYRLTEIKQFLGLKDWALTSQVLEAFNFYLVSQLTEISSIPGINENTQRHVTQLWNAARDPESKFPCRPDVYLKHYCMMPPELHQWFSTILLDEGQDTNPVISDWIMKQQTRKIIVGDDFQQLFRFRGAGNFLVDAVKNHKADSLTLTQSFRFGETIAKVANAILRLHQQKTNSEKFSLKGLPTLPSFVYASKPESWNGKTYTALHRSVAGTLQTALENDTLSLFWLGGFAKYRMQEVLDVYHLSIGEFDKIVRKKLLVESKNIGQYKAMAEQTQDHEQRRILKLLDTYGRKLPSLLKDVEKRTVTDISKADIVLGTLHSAKGLEFPRVHLFDDHMDLKDVFSKGDIGIIRDELNLLYVGATRAIEELVCNKSILYILATDPLSEQILTPTPSPLSTKDVKQNTLSTPPSAVVKKRNPIRNTEPTRTWSITTIQDED